MSSRIVLLLALGITATALVGCSGDAPQAEFVYDEQTDQLSSEARSVVVDVMKQDYGADSQHLVAWQRLPVEYGGIDGGKVVESSVDGDPRTFRAEVPANVGSLEGFDELFWTSGTYVDQTTHVQKFDPNTGLITFQERLDVPPGMGSKFRLKAGELLKKGRRAYMINCMHCHGVSGDGNGPTAKYLEPLPRDYRRGIFKFTSTVKKEQPGGWDIRRDDLEHTIRNGIPGTYMPSFLLMDDDELKSIIEYVRWLSMRGELERKLDADLFNSYSKDAIKNRTSGPDPEKREEIFKDIGTEVAESANRSGTEIATAWKKAEEPASVVHPTKKRVSVEQDPESLQRGRALFLSGKAKCVTCHGFTGRGDGSNTETVQQTTLQQGKDTPGLFDDWGHPIKPRNLTTGIFRGGRRPLDIYRRIRSGIKGTPMPPFGDDVLSDAEVWDLVNYVLYLPHELNGTYVPPERTKAAGAQSQASN